MVAARLMHKGCPSNALQPNGEPQKPDQLSTPISARFDSNFQEPKGPRGQVAKSEKAKHCIQLRHGLMHVTCQVAQDEGIK